VGIKIINAKKKRLTDEDIRMLAEMEEHPMVTKWDVPAFKGDIEKAYEGFKKSLEKLPRTQDEFLVAKVDKRVVGFVGIHRLKGEIGDMSHVGEVGIIVHPDFQSRGIGTKLLEKCISHARNQDFTRLEADTLAHNTAMRRILEKVGFKLEGIRRRRFKRNGKYLDEACYAILFNETALS
jgi:RimJ/RimL family protein N-acetyltransferase